MTDTPAKRPPNTTLPTLPDGWHYDRLEVIGPNGAKIVVDGNGGGKPQVTVKARDIDPRTQPIDSFADGVKTVGKSAKALARIETAEHAAKVARQQGLDALGPASHPEDEPQGEPEDDTDSDAGADEEQPSGEPATTASIKTPGK